MSQGKKGFNCDICGDPIILFPGEKLRPFQVKGIKIMLHMHTRCRPILMKASEARNWRLLPDGPLKEAYFAACTERGIKT